MKLIKLTQGFFTKVDDEDFDELNKHKWCVKDSSKRPYAVRGKIYTVVRMHRELLKAPKGIEVDHVNGDGLDNQRHNLRFATRYQNSRNVGKQKGIQYKSVYKGVHWQEKRKRWRARINVNNKEIYLGQYSLELDAAKAYNEAAVKYFGEFARLNDI